MTRVYYKYAHGALLVFDLSRYQSGSSINDVTHFSDFLTPLPPTNLFVKRLMYCPHKTLDIYPITAESHLLTDSKLNSVPYASDHLTFNRFEEFYRFEEVMKILFTFVTKPLAPPQLFLWPNVIYVWTLSYILNGIGFYSRYI